MPKSQQQGQRMARPLIDWLQDTSWEGFLLSCTPGAARSNRRGTFLASPKQQRSLLYPPSLHHLRTPPSSSSLPHVSRSPHNLLRVIPPGQFPFSFQQCVGGLPKMYQERSPCPFSGTCRPAPKLYVFQRRSRPHSSASPGTPERRR